MCAELAAIIFIVGMITMAISEFMNGLNIFIPEYRAEFIQAMKDVKDEGQAHQIAQSKINKPRRIYHMIALVGAILAAVGGYYGFLT